MAVTLRDIADQLNISQALVSRVLNDKPGVWASEETRRRIFETAGALNYRPSHSARALATGRSMQIAVSAADVDWRVGRSGRQAELRGLIDAAAAHHYRVLVLPSPEHHTDRRQIETLIHAGGCDGILLYAEQAGAELYDFLRQHQMPFIVLGNPGDDALPQVDYDNHAMMSSSVCWLHEQGRRRIAWAGTARGDWKAPFMQVLLGGYRDAVTSLCGGCDPALLPEQCASEEEILAFCRGPHAPDAVIVRGLSSALNWKMTLSLHGIRVRDDIALLAQIDTSELLHLEEGSLRQGLAFLVHDPHQVGVRAGEALIQWIGGTPPDPQRVLVRGPQPRWFDG